MRAEDDDGGGWITLVLFVIVGVWCYIAGLHRRKRELEMKCKATEEVERYLSMDDICREKFMEELGEDLGHYEELARERVKALENRRRATNRKFGQVVKDWGYFSLLGQWWYQYTYARDGRGWGDMRLEPSHWLMQELREKNLINETLKRQKMNEWAREYFESSKRQKG